MGKKLTDMLGIKCIPAISTGNLSEDNLANSIHGNFGGIERGDL